MKRPTCSTCVSFFGVDDTCHLNPPSVSIILAPTFTEGAPEPSNFAPQTFCAFPSTHKHEWCSKHQERLVITLSN